MTPAATNGGELQEERRGRVMLATLNRPAKLNAFTPEQYDRLRELLDRVRDDDSLSALVITGAGRAFSAGADVSLLGGDPSAGQRASEAFTPLLRALAGFDKPLVAAVGGLAVGFGATLLLHCDVVLASTRARLRYPFTELGLSPEAGSSYLLAAQVGAQRAAELFFEADWIDAERAEALGLVARLVPHDELVEHAVGLAQRYAERPLPALRATKGLLLDGRRAALEDAWARETLAMRASREGGEGS
jgi:enoyl-CoA hydratase/carnithine racemase